MLNQIISQIAQKVGIDEGVAEMAVGAMFDFLRKQGSSSELTTLFAHTPGATELADQNAIAEAPSGIGGLVANFMGGKDSGVGDAMALISKLDEAGLETGQIRSIGEELFSQARGIIGDDGVDNIIGNIPALKQFMG